MATQDTGRKGRKATEAELRNDLNDLYQEAVQHMKNNDQDQLEHTLINIRAIEHRICIITGRGDL